MGRGGLGVDSEAERRRQEDVHGVFVHAQGVGVHGANVDRRRGVVEPTLADGEPQLRAQHVEELRALGVHELRVDRPEWTRGTGGGWRARMQVERDAVEGSHLGARCDSVGDTGRCDAQDVDARAVARRSEDGTAGWLPMVGRWAPQQTGGGVCLGAGRDAREADGRNRFDDVVWPGTVTGARSGQLTVGERRVDGALARTTRRGVQRGCVKVQRQAQGEQRGQLAAAHLTGVRQWEADGAPVLLVYGGHGVGGGGVAVQVVADTRLAPRARDVVVGAQHRVQLS
jgi:hypothetical protein